MPEPPVSHICRRCHRPLDWHVDPDSGLEQWQHTALDHDTGNADHLPDPIPSEGQEVVGVCDFCSQPGPRWRYPAKSFESHSYGSISDWAACDTCHQFIEAGNYKALARRAADAMLTTKPLLRVVGRKAVAIDVRKFHLQFKAARSGPPFRVW